MKVLIIIFMLLNATPLPSSERFNNYRFNYKGKEFKVSEFISALRSAMPNKTIQKRLDSHIDAIIYYSLKRDLDPVLVLSMILVESGLINKARSVVGARGLMQIMPQTKEDIKHRILKNPKIDFDLDSPNENIDLGTIYVVYLLNKFDGNLEKTVIAYNEGPGYILGLPKNFKHNHRHFNRVNNVYKKINLKLMGTIGASRSLASLEMVKR